MKRRLVSAVLSAAMIGSMMAGATVAQADTIDNKDITIGVSIWSSTDVLGSQCKKILDEAAKALGVNVQYVDQGHVSEKVTASVEQLCAAGCQGIIICNSADSEMQSAIATCNANQVYLAQFFRVISEENSKDIYDLAKASDYYVGAVHENDDKWNKDHPDDQAALSEPQYAGTTSEGGAKAANALMSADPKLDALIPAGGGGEPLQGAISAVEAAGKTKDISIVSTDFLPDLGERLENGSMAGESGGHYCDPLFAFLMVYNAIKGNYTDFAGTFNEINFPYLYVSSADDYKAYEKYFVDQLPYTDQEIVDLSNESFEDLTKSAEALSIEDAAARAGGAAASTEAEVATESATEAG